MTRVAFILQEPTPYRTPHLDAVAAHPDLDVAVVYAAPTVQQRDWDVPAPSDRNIYLRGCSLPTTRILQHDYALTPDVWPLLNRLRPEVIVVGGWSLMATQLAIAWARVQRVPYLLMADNNLREPRPLWVRAVKAVVLRAVVPQAAGWLVPGTLGREHILHYGARPERTIVFPLTVDVARMAHDVDVRRAAREEIRSSFGIEPGAVAALHVGRLIPQKGVDVLVEATARARAAGAALHLLVAGSGPEEQPLRLLAESLDVPTSFLGFLDRSRLLDAYAAADLFCLLSRRETWGVVVNEAAAAGLPLLLSENVGASADLLVPDANGALVPPGDSTAAAAALLHFAREPELRSRYGDASRELVKSWGYGESVESLARLVLEIRS